MAKKIQASVTLGTSSTHILAKMPHKPDYIRITNDSDEVVYLKIGVPAVLNEGIRLAVGGFYEMKRGENMQGDYIDGISTSGSKKVSVFAVGSDIANYNLSVYDAIAIAENLGKTETLEPIVYDEISIAEDLSISNILLQVVVNDAIGIAENISGKGSDEEVSVYDEVAIAESFDYNIVP